MNWGAAAVGPGLVGLALAAVTICFEAEGTQPPGPGNRTRPVAASVNVDWSKTEVVTVTMTEYRFDPDRLRFRQGVPYRLRLENRGTEIHDFAAPDFFRAVRLEDMDVLGSYGTSIVLKPGEHKDVDFVALKPGSYRLTCADHDWAGMAGMIFVK